jgi:hypothetical protein
LFLICFEFTRTLKHVAHYSPLISEKIKRDLQTSVPQQQSVKQRYSADQLPLSELPSFLNKTYTLDVPVYTVWGACEDVRVLEKFRSGEYKVDKLHVIDEANSRLLEVGGVKLRLLGLGGAVVMHKLFDNGEGRTTIAGGQGTMWTTLLQIGELVDTANRVYDPTETRIFVTHASPAREGLLNQLSVTLKADFSISAGLHFRYGSSYNEFSVNPTLDHYRGKLAASKASFNDVWETVKGEVEPAVAQSDGQQSLLQNALDIVQKMPTVANGGNPFGGPVAAPNAGGQVDEGAFKNMWNFNLADATFGYLVLEIDNGRIGTEMKAQGFNFAHRGNRYGGGSHNQSQMTAAGPVGGATASERPPPYSSVPTAAPNQHAGPGGPFVTSHSHEKPSRSSVDQSHQSSVKPSPSPGPPRSSQPSPAIRNQPSSAPTPAGPNNAPTGPSANANVNLPTGDANSTEKGAAQSLSQQQPQEAARNGMASNDARRSSSANFAKDALPTEKKATSALFVGFVKDEEAARALFTDEDRAKIVRVERTKHGAHVTHFSTPEEAKAAFDHLPAERRNRQQESGQPFVRFYQERFGHGGDGGGAGRWQGSNRGGGAAGAPGGGRNPGGQGGYRSGGASDSEGGRAGRGGGSFRGGPRGARGERGRGPRGGGASGRGNAGPGGNGNSGAASPGANNGAGSNNASKGGSGPEGATPTASTPTPRPSGGDA